MAKKQTLKSLLGGSDGRVQASLDLGKKTLQPTVRAGGQSYTAVQATQSASQSQLGQLATALGKLNPALQNYQEGTYADAEVQKLEFKEQFEGMSDAEKAELLRRKENDLKDTERKINGMFRGNLPSNPLANIYAEKLVGGSKSNDFYLYSQDAIKQEQLRIEKLPISERPTTAEFREWTSGLIDSFNAQAGEGGSELFQKGSLRYQGLLASTKKTRDKMLLDVPTAMNEHFENTVYIPNVASNLRNVASDPEATAEERKEAITTFLTYLDPLSTEQTKQVFTEVINGFAAEDVDFARAIIADIVPLAKVGNQPMSQSSLYTELNELLDNKEDAFLRDKSNQETKQVNEYKAKFAPTITKLYHGESDDDGNYIDGTGGVDYTINKIEEERARIQEDDSLSDNVKLSIDNYLQSEQDDILSRNTRDVADVQDFVERSEMSTNANTGLKLVETDILDPLIKELKADFPNISQQNNPLYTPSVDERSLLESDLSAETLRIIGDERTEYAQAVENLYEKSLLIKSLDSREARADWVIENIKKKGGFADKFKERVKNRLLIYAERELGLAQEQATKEQELVEQATQAQEELQEISENKLTYKKGISHGHQSRKEGYYVDTLTVLQTKPKRTQELINNYFNTAKFLRTDQGDLSRSELLPDAYDKIMQFTLDSFPAIEKDALEGYGYRGANAKGVGKTREQDERDITRYHEAKAFIGYSSQEAVDIIESGDVEGTLYLYNDAGVKYNKEYFQENYKNINFPNLGQDSEADARLAELLGISVDELIKSQEEYKNTYFIK